MDLILSHYKNTMYHWFRSHVCTAVPSWSCSKAVYKPVWHIPLLSVQWINSWWWTDELSETCRVSCQNKFVKLMHLVGFIIKKFVTMHGLINVNFMCSISYSTATNPVHQFVGYVKAVSWMLSFINYVQRLCEDNRKRRDGQTWPPHMTFFLYFIQDAWQWGVSPLQAMAEFLLNFR